MYTSARLALLAGRQSAQAAFWALVRRNGVSTYYLAHTVAYGTRCERESRVGAPGPEGLSVRGRVGWGACVGGRKGCVRGREGEQAGVPGLWDLV